MSHLRGEKDLSSLCSNRANDLAILRSANRANLISKKRVVDSVVFKTLPKISDIQQTISMALSGDFNSFKLIAQYLNGDPMPIQLLIKAEFFQKMMSQVENLTPEFLSVFLLISQFFTSEGKTINHSQLLLSSGFLTKLDVMLSNTNNSVVVRTLNVTGNIILDSASFASLFLQFKIIEKCFSLVESNPMEDVIEAVGYVFEALCKSIPSNAPNTFEWVYKYFFELLKKSSEFKDNTVAHALVSIANLYSNSVFVKAEDVLPFLLEFLRRNRLVENTLNLILKFTRSYGSICKLLAASDFWSVCNRYLEMPNLDEKVMYYIFFVNSNIACDSDDMPFLIIEKTNLYDYAYKIAIEKTVKYTTLVQCYYLIANLVFLDYDDIMECVFNKFPKTLNIFIDIVSNVEEEPLLLSTCLKAFVNLLRYAKTYDIDTEQYLEGCNLEQILFDLKSHNLGDIVNEKVDNLTKVYRSLPSKEEEL
ncbi:hypothetical protein EIN_222250 [Entamoeba invadens IP1]|uniref:Uncharacterized protein n=1 Tax=Entamoeba invadens IP1 TaxID=370355 RepID=A0A0A1U208_ENTIV|nr:hypothetical protein EIN_222250 [Entamoeba invadens IP1]ELP88082.1 hypothetical protein EIN_222250 [Entamoeba invadens IP1]|eukprot:XP_004254853.1 hypothetical protein EIN_222250 [Entamoeba invadens IP1]